jgi:c-di-GMP-binding flagellar brake protein YcgR
VRFVHLACVYQFSAVYQRRDFEPLPVWIVGPAFDMKKIQRRSFFRLEVSLPVTIQVPANPELENSADVTLSLRTKDLSGGGMRVVTKAKIPEGVKVVGEIMLPNEKAAIKILNGKVVRVEPTPADTSINWVSIDFRDIDEHDRKKIVQFVFRKQLEHR